MSDTTQPSYYWISHQNNDLQQFSISVTLRRIHTDSSPHTLTHYSMDRQGVDVNVNKTFHAAVSNDEENNIAHQEASSSFAQTTHENIFWQEKLLGPKEMIEHEQFFQRPKKLYDGTHTNDNGIEKLNPEGAGTSDSVKQDMIFTYVDTDKYSSSQKISSQDSNDSLRSQPSKSKYNKVASPSHIRMQQRIERERPFQLMFIMAAIECDVKRLRRYIKKHKNIIDADQLPWHEQLLCRIKIDQDGLMEVTPGFSQEEEEEQNQNNTYYMFGTKDNFQTQNNFEGNRLTTFRFVSPSGTLYEYSLKRIGKNRDGSDTKISYDRLFLRDQQRYRQRNQKIVSLACRRIHPELLVHVFIDLGSAHFFHSSSVHDLSLKRTLVYVEYEVLLPDGWSCEAKSVLDENDSSPLRGCSQWVSPSYNQRTMRFRTLVLGGGMGIRFEPGQIMILSGVLGSIILIAMLYLPIQSFLIVVIPLVLISIHPNETSNSEMDHVEFKLNHPIRLHLRPPRSKSNTNNAALVHEFTEKPVILFQLWSKTGFNDLSAQGCSSYQLPVVRAAKEQICQLPFSKPFPSNEQHSSQCEIRTKMRDYLFGVESQIQSLRNSFNKVKPSDLSSSDFSLFTYNNSSETSGTLTIVTNTVIYYNEQTKLHHGHVPENTSHQQNIYDNSIHNSRETVDDVLMRLRKNRRERRIREILNQTTDPVPDIEELIDSPSNKNEYYLLRDEDVIGYIKNPRTANLLAQVESRKTK